MLAVLFADLVSGASYTYVALGVQGSDVNSTSPNGINDSRTVVGTYSVTQQCGVNIFCATPHGFIWKNGTFTSFSVPGSNGTVATAINNAGQIVGNYTTTAMTPQKSNGFIDNGGTFTTINVSGAVLTQPKGINNSGQVVGYFQAPSNQSPSDHAFLNSGGTFTTFDYPGATYTRFLSINDSGTITGVGGIGGTDVCFVYSAGVFTTINTSAYPGYFCNSAAINNSGQIALTLGTRIPTLTPLLGLIDTKGVFTAISVPGSSINSAASLNNLGDFVGLENTGFYFGYAALASLDGATLTSLNPNGATVGGPTFTLTVNGSNFASSATVQWNGSPLSTTFVNGTQLTATVPASLIANAGSASVTAVNPGSAASNTLTFSINPVTVGGPVITTLSPSAAIAGGSTFNLTVFGSNFVSTGGIFTSGATVRWNGSPLLTSFVSATQLTATVPGTLIANIGSASVTVQNPDGGVSNTANFTIASTSSPVTITSPPTLPLGAVGTLYSQSLSAAGGIPPYSWSLVSGALPSGLSPSTSGQISGTPTSAGTLSFTMKVVDAASSSATQTFSLTVGSSQSFTSALRIPQILDGAGWNVRFAIINTDQVPVTFTFQFWGQDGSALSFPILNGTPGVLTGTLPPGASFFAQSPGTSPTLQQGWAEIASSGRIGVTAIYQFKDGSPRDSTGTAIATLSGNSILMPFDNTQSNATAIAIANTNPTQALTVSMLFVTEGGAQSTSSLVLQPHTQQTFVAPTLNPAVAGVRGSIKFTAPTADIAVVGLEFTSTGQFTSLGTFQ